MNDITFDVGFTVTKTYTDVNGSSTSSAKNSANPFLKDITSTLNYSNVDWDGDGASLAEGDSDDILGWNPIRRSFVGFEGEFNGNGKTIRNLYINRSDSGYDSLFGGLSNGAKIYDLRFENAHIMVGTSGGGSSRETGILAGRAQDAELSNIYAEGVVKNGNVINGILVGAAYDTSIDNCVVEGDIVGRYSVGGIAGNINDTSISNSYSNVNIRGTAETGSLVGAAGYGYNDLDMCYATGSVFQFDEGGGSGFFSAGGLVGTFDG